MPIYLNFTGVKNFEEGAGSPPQGAYPDVVEKVEVKLTKSGSRETMEVSFKVTSGPEADKTYRTWYNLPVQGDKPEAIPIMYGKIRRFLSARGMPEVHLQGELNFNEQQLVGTTGVSYILDTGAEGEKRKFDVVPVLTEDKQNALNGTWRPGGGTVTPSNGGGQAMMGQAQGGQAQGMFQASAAPPVDAAPAGGVMNAQAAQGMQGMQGGVAQQTQQTQQQAAPDQTGAAVTSMFNR